MAKDNLIAAKYAKALVEAEASTDIINDLNLVRDSFLSNANLRTNIENPSISEKAKIKILETVFKDKISKDTLNTLKLCISKRRTKIISQLAEHYQRAYLEKNNIELASLESPTEISEKELNEIKEQLENLFNKGIKIDSKINTDLIAGVKINVNNKVLDYSLVSKIKKLKQSLE